MNQSCVNGGKCPWLLKTNIAARLGLCVTGDPRRLALGLAQANGRKAPGCWNGSVELRVVGQRREGEEQSHRICLKDTLSSDQQRWRKGSGDRGGRIFLSP